MNESLRLDFTLGGQPLAVAAFRANEGVTFERHPGVSPLNTSIGLQPRLPLLLDPVRRRHDWRDGEFHLDAAPGGGGIVLSGFGGDPEGLPAGVYDINVEIEALHLTEPRGNVTIRRGRQTAVIFDIEPEKRAVRLRGGIDPVTQSILSAGSSQIDGGPVPAWLADARPFPQRKACLLNVLAKMRAPQGTRRTVLSREIESVFWADVDRSYFCASPDILGRLEALAKSGEWSREGVPGSRIHENLVAEVRRAGLEPPGDPMALTSYRQGGRNSLQLVVASPRHGNRVYLDADIDLGNPLWDAEGFFVHLGELLNPGKTDHLSLHAALDRGATKDFLYYEIVTRP